MDPCIHAPSPESHDIGTRLRPKWIYRFYVVFVICLFVSAHEYVYIYVYICTKYMLVNRYIDKGDCAQKAACKFLRPARPLPWTPPPNSDPTKPLNPINLKP